MQCWSTPNTTEDISPLETEVILLRLSLGLRPLIRENVSSLWRPATVKKNKTTQSLFSLRLIVGVCASSCAPVCHNSFLSCRYDDGLRSEGPFIEWKISLRLPKAAKVGATRVACKYQFFEGKQTAERWRFMSEENGENSCTPLVKTQCDIHNRSSNYLLLPCEIPQQGVRGGRRQSYLYSPRQHRLLEMSRTNSL